MPTIAAVAAAAFACVQNDAGDSLAGFTLYDIRAWADQPGATDEIKFELPIEDKRSLGKNYPQFAVVATLPVVIRLAELAQPDEAGAQAAKARLFAAAQAVQAAIINNPRLWMVPIEEFQFVKSTPKVDANGAEIAGQWLLLFGLAFRQTADEFFVAPADDLTRVVATVDTADPADPTGTYAGAPFPDAVTPAPRTTGPDGRAEGGFDVTFTP